MIITVLILLGLCFGSFANALVWRFYQQSLPVKKRKTKKKDELSITKGRSMCVHCGHTLNATDLIPVLSWISLRGRCRYCREPISWQYPLVEAATAFLFLTSYYFWPNPISGLEVIIFSLWLILLVGFMALTIYDIRWMLLPNRIVFPLYCIGALFVLIKVIQADSLRPLLSAFAGILVGGGLFWVLFQVSKGRWIGGGDVKFGFLLGLIVGGPLFAGMVLFLASLIGTIFIMPAMAMHKLTPKTRIPFGPFLILATIVVQLFGHSIWSAYLSATGL